MSDKSREWLTLTQASSLLGIHPITLRSWADAGLVRLFRTPGGHRRFRRAELLQFMETKNGRPRPRKLSSGPDQTLALIRQEMGIKPIQQAPWYARLSEEQRSAHRELGQRLLGLLLQYVSHNDNAIEFLEQGCALARQYGVEAARVEMGSGELASAFLYFRRAIISTAYSTAGGHAQGDAEGIRLLQRINAFMDELLLAALTEYDLSRHKAAAPFAPQKQHRKPKRAAARKTG